MVKDIDNLYFTDEEYDIFAEKYQDQRTQYTQNIRKQIKEKLLDINKEILQELPKRNMQLYNHSNPHNTTSLIFPCEFNKGKVNWLGVRYGKSPKAIRELNKIVGTRDVDDPKYAFQKHACMQVNVGYNGVDIGIFHAVPNDAIDRAYLHEHIDKNDIKLLDQINQELNNLKGYGFEWNIWDTNLEGVELPDFGGSNLPEKVYRFDVENGEDFISWYSKNDRAGCYSSMLVHFPRYDTRVDENHIVETALDIFEQLYTLYKLISWDIVYNGKVAI